jgi:hypothetical protein
MKFFQKCLFLSLLASLTFAIDIPIQGTKRTPHERVYRLINDLPKTSITLDCSSFFHNLEFEDEFTRQTYYLTTEECWEAMKFFEKIEKRKKCLILEDQEFDYDYCEDLGLILPLFDPRWAPIRASAMPAFPILKFNLAL